MFDWYLPSPAIPCPVCGNSLREWQGKDGPCALLVWQQGHRSPVEHRVDADVADLDGFANVRLPPTFWLDAVDESGHNLIAAGESSDGVWAETSLVRVVELYRSRNGQSFVRHLWGSPDPLTPTGVADR